MSDGEIKLNRRQQRYIQGVLHEGKSRRRAALDAGYSQKSADNPGYNIERRGRGGNPVMRYFWDLLKPPRPASHPVTVGDGSENKGQFSLRTQDCKSLGRETDRKGRLACIAGVCRSNWWRVPSRFSSHRVPARPETHRE